MKFTIPLLALLPAVLALPATPASPASPVVLDRQSANTVTDELLFSITLPAFTTRRNNRNPATLDWTSDGCTSSPDNPFGFPFVPACNRHDFGYTNYRHQNRFTSAGKLRIDNNFRNDLYTQCSSSSVRIVCEALAEVYYAAVRAFGGGDATKRDTERVNDYNTALEVYHALVAEAQAKGELPVLE